MVGLLIVTHGGLAEEFVAATRRIVGDVPNVEAIAIGWDEDVAIARKAIEEAIKRRDRGQGVLILTDMFGGTPTNLALTFLEAGKVEIVTGVNLPMVVKFTNLRGEGSVQEIAAKICDQGRKSIHAASEVLRPGANHGAA
jgi:PTS system mannose-specific IIA component